MILAKRQAWGAGLGHFCNNYAFYFVISWLPLYLVKTRGFTVSQMAELGGLIYVAYAASSMINGWVSDLWMASGASATKVRLTSVVCGHLLTALGMAGCILGSPAVATASLFVAGVAFGFLGPQLYAIGQTLGGKVGGGKWVAFQNCIGNLAGIVAPIVTGFVVDKTGQFTWAFAVAAGIAVLVGVFVLDDDAGAQGRPAALGNPGPGPAGLTAKRPRSAGARLLQLERWGVAPRRGGGGLPGRGRSPAPRRRPASPP